MKRLTLLFIITLIANGCKVVNELKLFVDDSYDFSKIKRIAVVNFTDYAGETNSGQSITDAIEIMLAKNGYEVIDKQKVAEFASNHNIDLNKNIDVSTLIEFGKYNKHIDAIVTGSLTDYSRVVINNVPHTTVGISMRIFVPETGKLIAGASFSIEDEVFSISDISQRVVDKIIYGLINRIKR